MTQMNAILIHRNGGPEEMVHGTLPRPVPSAGQVLVRHTAIGVNFSDINVRRGGFYNSILSDSDQAFPLVLGNEGNLDMVDALVDDIASANFNRLSKKGKGSSLNLSCLGPRT